MEKGTLFCKTVGKGMLNFSFYGERYFYLISYSNCNFTSSFYLFAQEFKKKIKIFSTNKELSKVDSCIVFIMTHGTQHKSTNWVDLETADGGKVNSNWVIQQFANDICPLVTKNSERKPKMFFFQACRYYFQSQPTSFYTCICTFS